MVHIIGEVPTEKAYYAKERKFVVHIKKIPRNGHATPQPLVRVAYIDANKIKHEMEIFALKDTDVGIVAGELIHRLIPQIGDK